VHGDPMRARGSVLSRFVSDRADRLPEHVVCGYRSANKRRRCPRNGRPIFQNCHHQRSRSQPGCTLSANESTGKSSKQHGASYLRQAASASSPWSGRISAISLARFTATKRAIGMTGNIGRKARSHLEPPPPFFPAIHPRASESKLKTLVRICRYEVTRTFSFLQETRCQGEERRVGLSADVGPPRTLS